MLCRPHVVHYVLATLVYVVRTGCWWWGHGIGQYLNPGRCNKLVWSACTNVVEYSRHSCTMMTDQLATLPTLAYYACYTLYPSNIGQRIDGYCVNLIIPENSSFRTSDVNRDIFHCPVNDSRACHWSNAYLRLMTHHLYIVARHSSITNQTNFPSQQNPCLPGWGQ